MRKTLVALAVLALFVSMPVIAQEETKDQVKEEPKARLQWCVNTNFSPFSATYDSVNGDWTWTPRVKVMFLQITSSHKETGVRLLGVEIGLATFSSHGRKWTPLLSFIPIQVGRVSLSVTPYKVSRSYEFDYVGSRERSNVLVTLSVDW